MRRWMFLLAAPYVVMESSRALFVDQYGPEYVHYCVVNVQEKESVADYKSARIAADMAEALNAAHKRRLERDLNRAEAERRKILDEMKRRGIKP